MSAPRPTYCCGKCPPIVGGGYDCTCLDNPRCKKGTQMSADRTVTFRAEQVGRQRFAICQTCGATILTAYQKHWWAQTMTIIEINQQEITSHHYHQHLDNGDLE